MSVPRQRMRSPYMEFSKLRSGARFNLATSGVQSFPMHQFPLQMQQLEIDPPNGYGYAPLTEKIAKRNSVPAECVVTAMGTSMANHLAMAATLGPGDEALIEEPTYELLVTVARYLGAEIRRFPRKAAADFRIDPEEIRKKISQRTKLVVITNLHNPSSALTNEGTLKEVGKIAREAGVHVLVDEVYLEAMAKPPRSAFHLGTQFMATSSLTKGYGLSGIRCGWALAEPELAHRMWRLSDLFTGTNAHPAERMSVVALDNLAKFADRAQKILEANRRALQNFLAGREEIVYFLPPHGTTVFPRLKRGRAEEFCTRLRTKYDTSVAPGSFFEAPEHFRIGLGGEPQLTAGGLERLARALKEHGK